MSFEHRHGEQGFSLIGAIFLLVVIGMLVSMAMAFAAAQQRGVSTELLRIRATLAARAGLEWAAWQLRRNPGGAFATACQTAGLLPQPAALAGSLADFDVSLVCNATSHNELGATLWFYALSATASVTNRMPGQPGYAEAAVTARIEGD